MLYHLQLEFLNLLYYYKNNRQNNTVHSNYVADSFNLMYCITIMLHRLKVQDYSL